MGTSCGGSRASKGHGSVRSGQIQGLIPEQEDRDLKSRVLEFFVALDCESYFSVQFSVVKVSPTVMDPMIKYFIQKPVQDLSRCRSYGLEVETPVKPEPFPNRIQLLSDT